MRDILYYVPTIGRLSQRPTTLEHLDVADLLGDTVLVCPPEEVREWFAKYPKLHDVVPQPPEVHGIGAVRAFMFENCADRARHFFQIDDDVSFANRYDDYSLRRGFDDPARLRKYLHDHVLELFWKYDTVGIGWRMFCGDRPWLVECKQTGWAWGYNVAKVRDDLRKCHGRLTLFEDLDTCIQLLKDGHRSVISSYVVSQARRVSAKPEDGGCALYRTRDLVRAQAGKFYELHSDVATPRVPRNGLSADTQYLYKISWKKAFRPKEVE